MQTYPSNDAERRREGAKPDRPLIPVQPTPEARTLERGYDEMKGQVINRLAYESGANPARLIAWAKAEGCERPQEGATWYLAASYLADRELERWRRA
ncbi:hypothetical protein [Methylacidimicrobium tartarophylax]|uniref:Uncharacterized protein n=1 Tax=Methylacidimicrobium tartarophylax TaxID=1041768 RepID=A0A5E6MFS5_9BACT|nr:hypothetical protein [Methylacidimicrobium tartarophylax]VVM07103.1 hypothetical protein MAMT_01566 [Methylacidimicrobium tartarophylax]